MPAKTGRARNRPGQNRPGQNRAGSGRIAAIFERIEEALKAADVTDEQRGKLDPVLADAREKMAAIVADARANGAPDPQAIMDKAREVIDSLRQEAAKILTPEQFRTFEAAMRPNRAGPGGTGRDRPAPPGEGAKDGPGMNGDPPPPPPEPPAGPPAARNSTPHPEAGTAGLAASAAPSPAATPTTRPVAVGELMPEFDLVRTDGRHVTPKSFANRPAVFIFGSMTAPSFRDRADLLGQLAKKYGARVRFLIVYTREQHPMNGDEPERNRDDHIAIALHKTAADRAAAAADARTKLGLTLDVAPDTMGDTLTTALDGYPNGAAVFDADGRLTVLQKWVEPFALERALDGLLQRK